MTGTRGAAAEWSSVAANFAAATRRAPVARNARVVQGDGREANLVEISDACERGAPDSRAPGAGARVDPPTLLHPATYLCANCAGRFPARTRPTPYCSPQCAAAAKAVRYARKQRAEHGVNLPGPVRVLLHRKIVHAILECGYDKWSGQPEPDPVTPPAVHPLAGYVDPLIPARDTYAVKAQELMVRSLSPEVLLACDHQNWDSVWRAWVNLHAR